VVNGAHSHDEHLHGEYATVEELAALAARVEALEEDPEPPDPPVDGGAVPADATRQDIIDRYTRGTRRFLHTHDWVGKGPLPGLDGIEHIGTPVRQGAEVAVTASGVSVYARTAIVDRRPKLTSAPNTPVITPVSGRTIGVVLQGFEITGNSTHNLQDGVVNAARFERLAVTENHIHDNEGTAVRMGFGAVVNGNLIHHNEHLGIGGVNMGGSPMIVANELHHNTQGHDNYLWEGGELKVVLGNTNPHGLITQNYVHDGAIGLWEDIDANWHMQSNYVTNMEIIGMFIEAGRAPQDGPIRIVDNVGERNGYVGHPKVWDLMEASICLAEVDSVLVSGNRIHMASSRERGISLKQQKRTDHYAARGWLYTDHITIEGNTITRSAENSRRHIQFGDDTAGKSPDNGFIPYYLGNRWNDDVPASERATIKVVS
jgi:hypothetical protein